MRLADPRCSLLEGIRRGQLGHLWRECYRYYVLTTVARKARREALTSQNFLLDFLGGPEGWCVAPKGGCFLRITDWVVAWLLLIDCYRLLLLADSPRRPVEAGCWWVGDMTCHLPRGGNTSHPAFRCGCRRPYASPTCCMGCRDPTWAAGGGGSAEEMGGCGRVEVPPCVIVKGDSITFGSRASLE